MEKHLGSATGYPPKENLDFVIGHVAFLASAELDDYLKMDG